MHRALELYHKEGIEETAEDLQDYLDEYAAINNQDFDLCEEKWEVPLLDTDIMLRLKIDLIKDNILQDHKTTARIPTQQEIDQQKQLSGYSWAWTQKYHQREDFIRFNFFNTNPKPGEKLFTWMDTERTQADINEWVEWTRQILDGIANDRFDPKPARWHNYEDCPLYVERE